jgi:hypothetical protein
MNTREFRNAVPEGAFPWLENIQPIGPGNLHSIPGRGQALTRIPPTPVPPPVGCTDSTLRAACCPDNRLYQLDQGRKSFNRVELYFTRRRALHRDRRGDV